MIKKTTDMKILIHDIVKSKGYHVWKHWKNPKLGKPTSVHNLVDSLNDKINQKPFFENIEVTKSSNDCFEQLEFKF